MGTHVSKDLPTELLARLEPLQRGLVLRDALAFAVDALQRVRQVDGGHGGLGNVHFHLLLLGFEVEDARFLALLALLVLCLARLCVA